MTLAEISLREIADESRTWRESLNRKETDEVAEQLVARVLGETVDHRPDESDWYDVVRSSTDARTEVKSCWDRVGESYDGVGRYRLRLDQLRSLAGYTAHAPAWVAFVLFDESDGVARVRRARPSTVISWIDDRGGFNESGHDEFEFQHKLPWPVVFDS